MKRSKLIVLVLVAFAAVAHRSDGQALPPLAQQLRLAGVMPGGAMVYVQARDMSALMKTWLASTVRGRFYKSASFTAFSKSRIYLKLQDRRKDFETAVGFGLDENRLAELAGGASAVALYDIGKLELVLVTEVPRQRAIATALFKNAQQFEERSSDAGSYYVRDVRTDGGRLNQQFCFAYVEGRLIVTTTEGLMLRALANARRPGSDSLMADATGLAEVATGFTAHDVALWLDQARLNKNHYFTSNWIHGRPDPSSQLANIESALIDLRITREGLYEQRWFRMKSDARTGTLSGDQVAGLLRFAPASVQLVEAHALAGLPDGAALAVTKALLGSQPAEPEWQSTPPDRTHETSTEDDSEVRRGRYSRLDSRFDKDVDEEPAPAADSKQAPPQLAKAVASILSAVSPVGYLTLERSRVEPGDPFVRFDRAVVVEMKPDAELDREALEGAIAAEARSRFLVKGAAQQMTWQDESNFRYLGQSLLESTPCYAITSNYLVIASSRELIRDVLKQSSARSPATALRVEEPVAFCALVRVAEAKPVFDRFMSTLDRTQPSDEGGEEQPVIRFFSENLSSLIGASAIRQMRMTRAADQAMLVERVAYTW